ncbi:MAG: four-helix bundle copper-binding protein [Herminiimonas sp.]|nr:four-helix bundle copper-binding protein [Herminiimonas sp.]
MHHSMTADMRKCIESCQKCHNVCLQTAISQCLEIGGKHVEPAHFRLMTDCAAVCQTAADFMLRGSHFHAQACELCAAVCDACAYSCEQVGGMNDCVHACQNCAANCRHMVETTVLTS